ncbi:MAG: hypothetical protein DRI86_12970 [Bacteroidetes bacterium]|nr:MAG: hypothetical protein DRI86_12970 [Bacteroidota bacterium]
MQSALLINRLKFLLLTVLLISFSELKSQQIVTIGTGTTLEDIPAQGNDNYGWNAIVYPSWNMLGQTGNITKIAFDVAVVQDNASVAMTSQKIYIKEVLYSHFSSTAYINPTTSGATLVYDGNIQWNSLGWNTITLDQDYTYNGGHLLVLYENRGGGNTADFYDLRFNTTNLPAPNRCKKKVDWAWFPSSAGYYNSQIPNMQLTIIPIVPNNIAADEWILPQGDIVATSSSNIKVRVKNKGSVSQDTIAIKYSMDNGNSYIWDTIYNSISPSDTFTHTFSTTANLSKMGRYDCSFIVQNQGDTISLDDSLFYDELWVGSPLNGIYTIGSNVQNDFSELSDAINTLKHFGMSSSVVFELDSGIYTGDIEINTNITGLSSSDTLIIKGQGINSIISASNGGDNWILSIDNNSNITIDSISFYSSSNEYSGLLIINSDNITIKNCFVELPINSTLPTNSVRVSNCNDFDFSNNEVKGGQNGVNITGDTYSNTLNLTVINNIITDFRDNGIVSADQTNAAIDKNHVHSKIGISASNGIILSNSIGVISVSNNVIINNAGGGMSLKLNECIGDSLNPIRINNNMISCPNPGNNSFLYGIYISSGSYLYIYNNSVHIASGSGIYSRCFYSSNSSSGDGVYNKLKNNILSNFGDGYAIRIFDNSYPNYFDEIDYNNVYTKGAKYIKYGYNEFFNFASWKANTLGFATNSISKDPVFYSDTDLHSRSILMNDSGLFMLDVIYDIDGDMRNSLHPDIGADEYTPLDHDVVMLEWSSPLNGNPLSPTVPVEVLISNYGVQSQSNIPVKYSIDGGINYIVDTIAGPLNSYDSVLFTFATTANMNSFGIHYCKAIIDLPTDQYRNNDTISYKMFACDPMNGAYTLGSNINSDFASFDDLNYAINSCGVSGPVVIYVDSGTYNESIVFNSIDGASQTNTITIRGRGNGKTILTNSNANTNNRSVIKFDGAKYFVLDSLSIIRDSNVDYFWGVHFIHQANNNKISNCIIECGNGSSDNIIGIIAAGSSSSAIAEGRNTSNTIIENNRIIGGKYGINLFSELSFKDQGNIIRDNDIEDQYYCSISTVYQENLNIDGNRILGGPQSSKYAVGIRSARSRNKCIIEKNSVYLEGQYGICIDEYSRSNTSPYYMVVKNNFVNLFNHTPNLPPNPNFDDRIYGIYNYGSTYCRYYNNTVRVGGSPTNTGAAMYFYDIARANIKNNIFINEIGGSALDLYNNSMITYFNNDNNNLIASSGFYASADGYNYTNLTNWKTYSSAPNTVSIDPEFIGNNNFHANSLAMSNLGLSVSEVTDDIDGESRSSSPDMGADEYSPQSVSLGSTYRICDGDSVVVTSNIGSSYTYLWTFNGDTLLSTGPSVVIDTTGIITVEIVGVNSEYDTANVELIPYPIVNLGSDTTVKMLTGIIVLNAGNSTASFLWSTGDTTQSKAFYASNLQLGANDISVQVTKYTCSTTDSIVLTLIDDTSIDDNNDNTVVVVSPNPNKGVFNLVLKNISGDIEIDITDISGKIVFNKKYRSNGAFNETIDLPYLSKGMYILKIENEGRVKTQKFVVN